MDINNPSGKEIPRYGKPEIPPLNTRLLFKFLVIFAVIGLLLGVAQLYSDFLWFKALTYESVFLKILGWQILLFVVFSLLIFVIVLLNLLAARNKKTSIALFIPSLAGVSLFIGFFYRSSYLTILAFLNRTAFGVTDPIFSKDIAFYVFTLPFLNLILRFLILVSVITLVTLAVYYLLFENIKKRKKDLLQAKLKLSTKAKYHLSGVGAVFFILIAANYYLRRFSILNSTRGIVHGAGFTDVFVALPVFKILIVFSIIIAIILFIWPGHFKKRGFIAGVILTFIGLIIIGQAVVPALVQYLNVVPNEIDKERTFLEHNIKFTRQAYGLDKIEEQAYDVRSTFTAADIPENKPTLDNIRLWDSRPLKQTYKQIQEIRSYYDFANVDIDRYTINGTYTQIMLSSRELDQNQLPRTARTWVNEHLAYTHGYGATASPVNKFTAEGLPELYVKDLPPKSEFDSLDINTPGIYYGEVDNNYIIVKSKFREFDYPRGDENVYTSYEGRGGIPVDSFLNRLIMSLRFKDIKLLLTGQIIDGSKIMFNRNIAKRVTTIAPFIFYDSDPYLVIANNKLFWILDGYTVTDRYPYSEKQEGINYIRNSLKIVMDAFNGDVTYYVIDEEPIIQTYRNIFPALFRPFSEMDEELKKHIRYPETFFKVQSQMYRDYHMKDPLVFYNKEDKWDIPNEIYGEGQQIEMEPYYIIMKLPGEDKEEFIIMSPFTPFNKNNMIGWLAGRSDDAYGNLIAYKFPKESLIFGPLQVEARIDQDSQISQQLTLWDQRGSSVIRGNLLVIPIDHSLLYIEPLYLLAERSQLPELKRVIVYFNNIVVMERNLETALTTLFGLAEEPPEEPSEEPSEEPLVSQAITHYNRVQEAMARGDWVAIGRSMAQLQKVLEELKTD